MRGYIISSAVLFAFVALGSWVARQTGWYNDYWYTDIILHTAAGMAFGLFWIALHHRAGTPLWLIWVGAVAFAVFSSVLWEFWEFAGWRVTPSHMRFYIPELGDTLGDLACGMAGGLMSGLILVRSRYTT